MGMGQTILATAFLVLISVAIINIVKMVGDKDVNYYDKKSFEQAAVLANSLLNEISTKKYDANVDTGSIGYLSPPSWSVFGTIGPSGSASSYVNPGGAPDTYTPFRSIRNDNSNYFDDVDDYNGYVRSTSSGGLTGFRLWVSVYYVNASSVPQGSPTYYKKVDVSVSNAIYLSDTLIFSRVISY